MTKKKKKNKRERERQGGKGRWGEGAKGRRGRECEGEGERKDNGHSACLHDYVILLILILCFMACASLVLSFIPNSYWVTTLPDHILFSANIALNSGCWAVTNGKDQTVACFHWSCRVWCGNFCLLLSHHAWFPASGNWLEHVENDMCTMESEMLSFGHFHTTHCPFSFSSVLCSLLTLVRVTYPINSFETL
jgi:hypothetical protein